jgi:glycosyltransferase involved in cell wall biosynthesis
VLTTDSNLVARPASPARNLRVVFCWSETSGYMAACWRALAARPNIDVHVIHLEQLSTWQTNRFQSDLAGVSHEMFSSSTPDLDAWLLAAVTRQQPDVVVVCGWVYWPYTRLVRASALESVRKVLGMDSPWEGRWKQRFARFRLASTLRRFDVVVTAGERSATYAQRLGVPDAKIRTGFYGFDYNRFATVLESRSASHDWPRRFLFVGRYVPQKDLGMLLAAYEEYRHLVDQPWELTCCGYGPESGLLADRPGVTDIGFKSQAELPALFERHGAFVMSSHFEPWGVVLAEAAASGLPLVCTRACGASVDLVRPYFNGLVTAPRDVHGLARALQWIHEHETELPAMGARSRALAEGFSAESWAARWHHYLLEALQPR